ncbi:hypothetical protein DDB_G0293004 [Dictyostelium discoideum AX4]|uniref:P-type ATPase A domain-containing protein n=1 Tax=Dictyostelium discoideum TaxID=44689 RepID=Q54CD1_DICDI|nr:hypothetical protein DDB_G0293004 [Dictyostelium discoideum AX4]EAL60854.1 hypothetical protein DDB_G0293004 [Dictyostelium discoideum AX4]|eukprot:XP_629288.1 hypothetical protein DDB_G0293004 [Dictyostelium discoideum AX4]
MNVDNSKGIKSIQLYRIKPSFLHLNVIPFIIIYIYLFYLYSTTPIEPIINNNNNNNGTTLIKSNDSSIGGDISNDTIINNNNNSTESGEIKEDENQVEFNLHVFLICSTMALHFVSYLFNHWSIDYKCFVTMKKVDNIKFATHAKVTPGKHMGMKQLCPISRHLHRAPSSISSASSTSVNIVGNGSNVGKISTKHLSEKEFKDLQYSIEFQKRKLVYNPDKKQFEKIKFHIPLDSEELLNQARSYETDEQIELAAMKYGLNRFDIPIPTFLALYKEQAIAPFFVFQVFCVLLWCLEEYVFYCLFSLFMLLVFEATVVKSRLSNLNSLRNMSSKPTFPIYVYRLNQWKQINTTEILPGDIVSIGRGASEATSTLPCDMILLSGGCVVNEAMLTGESTPHHKESIKDRKSTKPLDLKNEKIHILYGGTTIVQHTPSEKLARVSKPPDRGCIAYAYKTGFNTNQGRLMRTIWFSSERVTANNKESFLFILFLLTFAIAASAYLFNKGIRENNRSKYKLLLNCIMVITSVVPPELPMELSLAVNNSLISLIKLGIYCTEPFRIPFAGKVDVCCFDKTGTLTTDDLVLQGIANCPKKYITANNDHEDVDIDSTTTDTTTTNTTTTTTTTTSTTKEEQESSLTSTTFVQPSELADVIQFILAGCHSLVLIDNKLVGDPMEMAGLKSIPFTCKADKISHQKKPINIEIVHRYHFSSELKRMTTICNVVYTKNLQCNTYAFSKGAPEIMKPFFNDKSLPDNYDQCFKSYSRQGSRVLALGYKRFESGLNVSQYKSMERDSVESNLEFGGFIIFDCPLKPDSKESIEMLMNSSHRIVMITGDNSLTACHVGKQLGFVQENKQTIILQKIKNSNNNNNNEKNEEKEENNNNDNDNNNLGEWVSVDESIIIPLENGNENHLNQLDKDYNLCIGGNSLDLVIGDKNLEKDLYLVKVFARVSPEQKQMILTNFKVNGHYTLMAGDGTNDVGALKQAHVGIAILNKGEFKPPPEINLREIFNQAKQRQMQEQLRRNGDPRAAAELAQKQAADLAQRMQQDNEVQMVKLGDASIAAPFTSKSSAVKPITHIIRQGRCTLVTTFQMYKILALNSLITAYGLSVLYLDGVKLGDTQATISGMLIAVCFLFISTSKPLMKLANKRPNPNLFSPYMMCSILLQFALHLVCIIFIVHQSQLRIGTNRPDPDSPFAPNLLNSAVFLMSNAMQVATFAVNYKGHPFMQSLSENKPLLYALSFVWGLGLLLATEIIPPLNSMLELVEFPDSTFRLYMVGAIILDLVGAWFIEKVCSVLLKN